MGADQTFGQGEEFGLAAVGLPDHAAVIKQTEDSALRRTAEGLDAVARQVRSAFAKALDDFHHALPVQHAGDVVGDGGHNLTAAASGQIGEDKVNDRSSDFSKRVAVKEKEWSLPVTAPERLYGFVEGEDFGLLLALLCFSRSIALRILAVLRASSCARSSIEADDKLPTPVLEKLGSGL